MDKFKHVIGVVHTNYLVYTRSISGGVLMEPLVYYLNQGMCRAYCHKIIKLSGALQEFAAEKEVISNVHGMRILPLLIQLLLILAQLDPCNKVNVNERKSIHAIKFHNAFVAKTSTILLFC